MFDFAVVVFGVRVSIPASFLSRAVASWTLCSRSLLTAFQLFRAETLGGSRDVATRTHARVEHVSIAPFRITLHMLSLNIRLSLDDPARTYIYVTFGWTRLFP